MIEKFITYLISIRGYSRNTAYAYESDVRQFARWMREHDQNARWSTTTREEIDMYIIEQQHRGLKPASTNRQLAAISSLYKFMKREGYAVDNPTKYESRRKIGERIPNTIPIQDITMAYHHAAGVTKLMIGLLTTTAMRISEMLSLTWEDINFTTGVIKITGKGNKQRIVTTDPKILEPIAQCRQNGKASGKMFGIDDRTARYMIWQALKPFSNAQQLSPHAIRHSVATHMAKNGQNVAKIATLLGHKSIKTTQQYIDMAQAAETRTGVQL